MSYIVYLAEISPALARRYFAAALRLCRWARIAPSVLLHSHDFLGPDDVPAMRFFPGFRLPGAAKVQLVADCIDLLGRDFDVLPLGSYVAGLTTPRLVEPRFFHRDDRREPAPASETGGRG